jgi:hypothetical protein
MPMVSTKERDQTLIWVPLNIVFGILSFVIIEQQSHTNMSHALNKNIIKWLIPLFQEMNYFKNPHPIPITR